MNLSYLVLMMAFFMKQVVLERQARIDLQCMEVEVAKLSCLWVLWIKDVGNLLCYSSMCSFRCFLFFGFFYILMNVF